MRSFFRIVSLAALAAAGIGFLIWAWIQWRYDRLVFTDLAEIPQRPVAIVFGAGIGPDGSLSPMLRDRMDTAVALYRSGIVHKLLVSGDNRFVDYDEPGRMYDYAVAQGVSPADVVRDYAGRRTYDTCYRAGRIFGVTEAILVTQRFHLPRAIFTCRGLGMDAMGFSADRRVYYANSYYRLRDALATLRAWADVRLLRPTPVLGEPIDIGL